jgi:4-hydroxy-tetrahydrodipicolinate reductase
MGQAVSGAVAADPELELVGAVDPQHVGEDAAGVTIVPGVDALEAALPEVVVDFTQIDAARQNLEWCADHGVHAVVGTTGFTDDDLERLRARFTKSNCFIAPNFAIGAVLLIRFAELAAPWFETGEIIELHHDQKIDAPSGTAMLTAERMAGASAEAAGPAGIRVHSVRLRGLVAHEEVILGTTGQSLSIRHDSYDRSSFLPGVVLAVKAIASRPGVTVGLDALLDL